MLDGKRVAVLVESEFIPEEIDAYRREFRARGASVDFVSRLWGSEKQTFISDVEHPDQIPVTLDVTVDIGSVDESDYAAVIMSANYTSVRLRYFEPATDEDGRPLTVTADAWRSPPAVQFFARAMGNPAIVKGALCHGLWILTPVPELLRGRRVICHRVVLADIMNAGGVYTPSDTHVVVDADLVTGERGADVVPFIEAITEKILRIQGES